MRERNAELGIKKDKKQVNNDMHEGLLNGITNLVKELLNTEVKEVQERTVIELIQENHEVVKRIKTK
jgi:hypothetical protein